MQMEMTLAAIAPRFPLESKGPPIGATGVSMHALVAMQLTGQAPEGMQLPNADIGGVFNMGGAAVANYVLILEAAPTQPLISPVCCCRPRAAGLTCRR